MRRWAVLCALLVALPAAVSGGNLRATTDLPVVFIRTSLSPRFIQTQSTVVIDGMAGTSTAIYDLKSGRYKERVDAGLASHEEGFDGSRHWATDVSGMPLVDDTLDGQRDWVVWARLLGSGGNERIVASALPARGHQDRLRLRYAGLSGPLDVTFARGTRLITTIDDFSGSTPTSQLYADYRSVDGVTMPFDIRTRSLSSASHEIVVRARALVYEPNRAFTIPAVPADTTLDGTTTLPLSYSDGQIVIPIRIDSGPMLHVLFDSGSTNYLLPATARRLGLATQGRNKSGGFGPGLVDQQFTRVGVLHIGSARVSGVPFNVVDDKTLAVDGVVGCEMFMRFAVQFDFSHGIVVLSKDIEQMKNRGVALPIRIGSCQAETDASLDGIAGNVGIDTGSAWSVDIMTPFVRAHHLLARYHATHRLGGAAIGGRTTEYYARAKEFRLGPFAFEHPDVDLGVMTTGAYADPTEMANIGLPLLQRFIVTLDYRAHRMWLRQTMPLDHLPLFSDWGPRRAQTLH